MVVAYNRPNSLNRLLASLECICTDREVPLAVSVDGEHPREVARIAKNFSWPYGPKDTYFHCARLGLKDHILWCGDLSRDYEGVVILEDDLVVAPGFYNAAVSMLSFYRCAARVGGVALYSPTYNEVSQLPFIPIKTDFSNFFYQLPCSWGQGWTREQWMEFRLWMKDQGSLGLEKEDLPKKIREWPNTSWKRWFSYYLIENNKFFAYPYDSYTTNCADAGTHFALSSNRFQVPITLDCGNSMVHPEFGNNAPIYDTWGEILPPCLLKYFPILGDLTESLEVDIHCSKQSEGILKYPQVLTTAPVDEEEKSWPLVLKPIENNLFMTSGDGRKIRLRLGKLHNKNRQFHLLVARIRLFQYYFGYERSYKVIFYFFWCFAQDLMKVMRKLKGKLLSVVR